MKRVSSVWNRGVRRFFIFGILIVFAGLPGNAGQAAKMLSVAQPGIAPGWVQSRPDARISFSDLSQHALRFRTVSPYYPSIAYGGDHLYYSYQDAGGWHTVTVDSAWNVGSGAALALDPSGYAHISYYDAANGNLKYATNRWGSWSIEVIASAGYVGRYSDIAIDFTGNPSIVYYNWTTSELHYINFDPAVGWTADEVVATGLHDNFNHPGWFSLAMDPTAYKPHVSYYQYSNNTHGSMEWAHYDNSFNWVRQTIKSSCHPSATTCKAGEYNSIALDPSTHRPAIAYSYYDAYAYATLLYSSYNGSSWEDDYAVPAMSNPTYVSLGIDLAGHPQIAWNESGLRYSQRDGTWSTLNSLLDPSATAGKPVSLAISNESAKVAYYDDATGILAFLGRNRDGGWLSPVTLATQGHDVGRCSSLSVDKLGRANISYYDETNKHLLYARYSGSAWTYNSIDSSGNAACFSVMGANPVNGNPSVAYISSGNLYYRTGNGTTWNSPIPVDSGVDYIYDAYQAFSMAFDSDGKPNIVYRKGGNVIYVVYVGTSWVPATLATGTVTSYVTLAIGPDKQPQVAFYESGALKYRRYFGGIWQSAETVAASGSNGPGVGVAMVVDKNNLPTVAFLNSGGTDLRASSRSAGGVWTISPLLDDYAEEYFSLAIDSANNLHLAAASLVTNVGSQLHYHTRKGGTWSMLPVDTLTGLMSFPSISLTTDGMPRISYYDLISHDLLFVLKLNRSYLPFNIK